MTSSEERCKKAIQGEKDTQNKNIRNEDTINNLKLKLISKTQKWKKTIMPGRQGMTWTMGWRDKSELMSDSKRDQAKHVTTIVFIFRNY